MTRAELEAAAVQMDISQYDIWQSADAGLIPLDEMYDLLDRYVHRRVVDLGTAADIYSNRQEGAPIVFDNVEVSKCFPSVGRSIPAGRASPALEWLFAGFLPSSGCAGTWKYFLLEEGLVYGFRALQADAGVAAARRMLWRILGEFTTLKDRRRLQKAVKCRSAFVEAGNEFDEGILKGADAADLGIRAGLQVFDPDTGLELEERKVTAGYYTSCAAFDTSFNNAMRYIDMASQDALDDKNWEKALLDHEWDEFIERPGPAGLATWNGWFRTFDPTEPLDHPAAVARIALGPLYYLTHNRLLETFVRGGGRKFLQAVANTTVWVRGPAGVFVEVPFVGAVAHRLDIPEDSVWKWYKYMAGFRPGNLEWEAPVADLGIVPRDWDDRPWLWRPDMEPPPRPWEPVVRLRNEPRYRIEGDPMFSPALLNRARIKASKVNIPFEWLRTHYAQHWNWVQQAASKQSTIPRAVRDRKREPGVGGWLRGEYIGGRFVTMLERHASKVQRFAFLPDMRMQWPIWGLATSGLVWLLGKPGLLDLPGLIPELVAFFIGWVFAMALEKVRVRKGYVLLFGVAVLTLSIFLMASGFGDMQVDPASLPPGSVAMVQFVPPLPVWPFVLGGLLCLIIIVAVLLWLM